MSSAQFLWGRSRSSNGCPRSIEEAALKQDRRNLGRPKSQKIRRELPGVKGGKHCAGLAWLEQCWTSNERSNGILNRAGIRSDESGKAGSGHAISQAWITALVDAIH